MKHKKSLICFTAFLTALTIAPAAAYTDVSVVKAADQCDQGTKDGYDWELWNQNYTGNVSMQVGSNGTYSCSWSGIENCLFRSGKRLGSTKSWQDYGGIQVKYDVDYTPKGNSYMCIYGWTQNPLVEYYIVEAWGDWRPPGSNNARANITVDGKGYDVYTSTRNMQPSIEGTKTFEQYWSVQKTNPAAVNQKKNLKGTITVSDHFAAWERSGMKMGKMYEVALNVEGYRSSGEAQVKQNTLLMGNIDKEQNYPTDPPAQQAPSVTGSAPSGSGTGVSDTFEGTGTDWTARGDGLTLKMATSFKNAGSKSLYVTGRTESWQGFQCSSSELKAGGTYEISMNVGYQDPNYSSAGFTVGVQYDSAGKTSYDNIADATCSTGKWTELGGKFSIPSGAENISLYVQTAYTESPTAADLIDFFIDNVTLTGGSAPATTTAPDTTTPPVNTDPGNPTPAPGVSDTSTGYLKDAFASFFRVGTSVSAYELNSQSTFIRNHFNSITPENELKPEAIINQSACQQFGNNVNTQIQFSSGAQQIMKFCSDNGIPMRGHTFVWYSQTPDWFFRENFSSNGAYVSSTIMDQRLESMIKNTFEAIAKQYPKLQVYSYDVCNELFVNDGGGMRPADNSNWMRVYGDDSFVTKAFAYAREYAPSTCKLYLNDYNEYIPAKTNDIYNMALKVKAQGNIDGIGMQSHLDVSYPSASVYKTAMEKFLSSGLDVQVTELDITMSGDESPQASLFAAVFQMCVDNYERIPALTVWGTSDGISWRKSQNPLIFNSSYQPKKAYSAVMDVAKGAKIPASTTPSTTQAPPTTTPATTTSKAPTTTTPAPQTSVVYGDLDTDNTVDLTDLTLLSQYLLQDVKFNSDQLKAADVTGDGAVNVSDLALLKQYVMNDNVTLGK